MTTVTRAPYFYRNVGAYNWANPSEKQANLTVQFELDGKRYILSDTVEPDGQYDYDGDDPFEAVESIAASMKRYWINTRRQSFDETLDIFNANRAILEEAYLLNRAIRLQKDAAEAYKKARLAVDVYNDFLNDRVTNGS